MPASFFEHQERARKRTMWLVLLFALAVAGIGATIYLVLAFVLTGGEPGGRLWDPELFLWVMALTIGFIGLASLFRVLSLRSGGGAVARMLGGRLVSRDTKDLAERRLLNVVDEMAIASGIPVPEVYVLDEEAGINAFAAGYSVENAAVAVTRGALKILNRDELQGVIAHEFSHILNGDMRLNLRLIGVLFGIFAIAIVGRLILYSVRSSAFRRSKALAGVFLVGLTLMLVGYIGEFVGRLIQAAVSRQREFLADASAVQFTRNPAGIGGALLKIARLERGSAIEAPRASEAAHLFFGEGVRSMFGLLATHPPIEERIRRIDPSLLAGLRAGEARGDEAAPAAAQEASLVRWTDEGSVSADRGEQEAPAAALEAGLVRWTDEGSVSADHGEQEAPAAALEVSLVRWTDRRSVSADRGKQAAPAAALEVSLVERTGERVVRADPEEMMGRIGTLDPTAAAFASDLIAVVSARVSQALQTPDEAGRVVYALLLDADPAIRQVQFEVLTQRGEDCRGVEALAKEVWEKGRVSALPLVELAVPALRQWPRERQAGFLGTVEALIRADRRVSLFEFGLHWLVTRRLSRPEGPSRAVVRSIEKVAWEAAQVLAAVARAGHPGDEAQAMAAFRLGLSHLGGGPADALMREFQAGRLGDLWEVGKALDRLVLASLAVRRRVVEAVAHCALADREVTEDEAEVLRLVAGALALPLPPRVETGTGTLLTQ